MFILKISFLIEFNLDIKPFCFLDKKNYSVTIFTLQT